MRRVRDRVEDARRTLDSYQAMIEEVAQESDREESNPMEQFEAVEGWAQLDPADQATLLAALKAPSMSALAVQWGLSLNGAKSRVERSRAALRKIVGDL